MPTPSKFLMPNATKRMHASYLDDGVIVIDLLSGANKKNLVYG